MVSPPDVPHSKAGSKLMAKKVKGRTGPRHATHSNTCTEVIHVHLFYMDIKRTKQALFQYEKVVP